MFIKKLIKSTYITFIEGLIFYLSKYIVESINYNIVDDNIRY